MTWCLAIVLIVMFLVFGFTIVSVVRMVTRAPGSGNDVSLALTALAEPFRAIASMLKAVAKIVKNLRK